MIDRLIVTHGVLEGPGRGHQIDVPKVNKKELSLKKDRKARKRCDQSKKKCNLRDHDEPKPKEAGKETKGKEMIMRYSSIDTYYRSPL